MKILLVRPPRIKQAITLSNFMFSEPLGLEMIYGVYKESNQVEIFDMMIEEESLTLKIKEYKPEYVGVTSLCIDVTKVIELCREVKLFDRNIVTFVGGTQAYLSPESFFSEYIDGVFNYTNKKNLVEFINNEVNIAGVYQKKNDFKENFKKIRNEYILPDRESTKKYREHYSYFGYKPAAIMEFGLGCEKACSFCLRWRIEGHKEVLIDESLTRMDLLSIKEDTIMFIDNDFLGSMEKIIKFLEIVKDIRIEKNYIIYGSVSGVLENEDLLRKLKEIGLKAILIGYETFSDDELKTYNKNVTVKDNLRAAEVLKTLKLDVWASFMAHPDWDKNDFKKFRRYIKSLNPEIASINPLTPFPNLPIYEEYKDRLLFPKDDYEKWSFGQLVVKPSKISLRMYYFQLLLTYFYLNLAINKNTEMIKKYGVKNIFRIIRGSFQGFTKYLKLIVNN